MLDPQLLPMPSPVHLLNAAVAVLIHSLVQPARFASTGFYPMLARSGDFRSFLGICWFGVVFDGFERRLWRRFWIRVHLELPYLTLSETLEPEQHASLTDLTVVHERFRLFPRVRRSVILAQTLD
jgi:hypothetical protein